MEAQGTPPPVGIVIDLALWPIVRCTPYGRPSDEDLDGLFREYERLWRRGERFLTITDLRFSQNVSGKQRQRIGEWIRENSEAARHCTVGAVVIVESMLVRGALTAINWIAQPEYPTQYAKDWQKAAACAERWLDEGGLLNDRIRGQLGGLSFAG